MWCYLWSVHAVMCGVMLSEFGDGCRVGGSCWLGLGWIRILDVYSNGGVA